MSKPTKKKTAPQPRAKEGVAAKPKVDRNEEILQGILDRLHGLEATLYKVESSVAVIRSGSSFMQQLEKDAPIGLQRGDYTDASKEVADELTAMGMLEGDASIRYKYYVGAIWDRKMRVWGSWGHSTTLAHPACVIRLDAPTFLSRARVTAKELGLNPVEAPSEVWVPKVGDWVILTAKSGIFSRGHIAQVGRIGPQGGVYLNERGGHGVERKHIRPATEAEVAAHLAAEEAKRKEAKRAEKAKALKFGVRVMTPEGEGVYWWKTGIGNHKVTFPNGDFGYYTLDELTPIEP